MALNLFGYRKGDQLSVVRAFDEKQAAAFQHALLILRQADEGEIPFHVLLHDLSRLRAQVGTESVSVFDADEAGWDRMTDQQTELCSVVLGTLAAFRLYLDNTETRLKRMHGEQSVAVLAFKAATKQEYDQCFSYRFWHKLRNFIQHQALPIRLSDLPLESEKVSVILPAGQLKLVLDVPTLLRGGVDAWTRPLLAEIEAQGSEIPIAPLLPTLEDSLWRVHRALNHAEKEFLRPSAQVIRDLVEPAIAAKLHPVIAEVLKVDGRFVLRIVQPPATLLEALGVDSFRLPPENTESGLSPLQGAERKEV